MLFYHECFLPSPAHEYDSPTQPSDSRRKPDSPWPLACWECSWCRSCHCHGPAWAMWQLWLKEDRHQAHVHHIVFVGPKYRIEVVFTVYLEHRLLDWRFCHWGLDNTCIPTGWPSGSAWGRFSGGGRVNDLQATDVNAPQELTGSSYHCNITESNYPIFEAFWI